MMLSILSLAFLSPSCDLLDPCASVTCENGGTCVDGTCECAAGFEGESCATVITVTERLERGESPLEIAQSGVSLDSLYGKTYKGGIVFFVNTDPSKYPNFTGDGMVTTDADYGNFDQWGCGGVETGATGAAVGDGPANTQKIIDKMCSDPSKSATICDELVLEGFDDWFLPSIAEMDLMYENLHAKGHSNFLRNIRRFQSSTEADADHFRLRMFYIDSTVNMVKFSGDDIRPARIF